MSYRQENLFNLHYRILQKSILHKLSLDNSFQYKSHPIPVTRRYSYFLPLIINIFIRKTVDETKIIHWIKGFVRILNIYS